MGWGHAPSSGSRDFRIDWLRGLAMTCVIINHSQLSSLLSWFSYERLWVVTAAEVFVVLSGIVLGMVYGRRAARNGWAAAVRGLTRRAAFLYFTFVAVTVSVLALSAMGVDVRGLAPSGGHQRPWFFAPRTMDAAAWRDVLLMRTGPWAFEIIGLYVWLVATAVPCLLLLRRGSWRLLLAASWALYLWNRLDPHAITTASFESAFPLLAWQVLFVHGIAIGYHRERIGAFVERAPTWLPATAALATGAFALFAFCNPWADGPSWLHLDLVSSERFTALYGRYFELKDLGLGRLLNLALGLATAYAALTRHWVLMRPFHTVFITLGQQSLGAFVVHVYALLLLAQLPLPATALINTLVQVAVVGGIVFVLQNVQRLKQRDPRRVAMPLPVQRVAA
jgi:hypothetical protein